MAAEWRNFKAKMKTKRIDKDKGKKNTVSAFNDENDTLVVQRLSAEVSGKAQKYSRVGAREFVSYEYEEFTVENIRRACEKHFAVDQSISCYILAGEQGPSCNTVKQIPDSRVIHVRFVERVGEGTELGIRERGSCLKEYRSTRLRPNSPTNKLAYNSSARLRRRVHSSDTGQFAYDQTRLRRRVHSSDVCLL